jgi:hypothetical protein
LAGGVLPAAVAAQTPAPTQVVVHARVADTTGAPLADATVTILRTRQQEAVLVATTDAAGRHTFAFTPDSSRYQIVARKLGYVQTARLVLGAPGDTLSFDLRLARLPPQLDTVRAYASANTLMSYYIGADEIAASTRGMSNAFDVLRKLRPNMLGDVGRACTPNGFPGQSTIKRRNAYGNMVTVPNVTIKHVWVNGERITMSLSQDDYAKRDRIPPDLLPESLLTSIKPEHIAEARYISCWDTSVPGIGGQDAVLIILKPGIAYSRKRGSHVVDSTLVPPPQ